MSSRLQISSTVAFIVIYGICLALISLLDLHIPRPPRLRDRTRVIVPPRRASFRLDAIDSILQIPLGVPISPSCQKTVFFSLSSLLQVSQSYLLFLTSHKYKWPWPPTRYWYFSIFCCTLDSFLDKAELECATARGDSDVGSFRQVACITNPSCSMHSSVTS